MMQMVQLAFSGVSLFRDRATTGSADPTTNTTSAGKSPTPRSPRRDANRSFVPGLSLPRKPRIRFPPVAMPLGKLPRKLR
jgi:hypothetical protein